MEHFSFKSNSSSFATSHKMIDVQVGTHFGAFKQFKRSFKKSIRQVHHRYLILVSITEHQVYNLMSLQVSLFVRLFSINEQKC